MLNCRPIMRRQSFFAFALRCLRRPVASRRRARRRRRTAVTAFIPRETETIEGRVPPHATLDTLLKSNGLVPAVVQAALVSARSVFDPRQLRAERPYKVVRSLDRRFARVRVPNRHGPFPPHHLSGSRRSRVVGLSSPSLRQADIGSGNTRPHRRGPSVSCRRDRCGGRNDPAGDVARRHVRRPDRLRQRSPAGGQCRGPVRKIDRTTDSSPATGRCSGPDSSRTAASTRRFAGPIRRPGKSGVL